MEENFECYTGLDDIVGKGLLEFQLYNNNNKKNKNKKNSSNGVNGNSLLTDTNKPLRGYLWKNLFSNSDTILVDDLQNLQISKDDMNTGKEMDQDDLDVMALDIKRLMVYDIYQSPEKCKDIETLLYNYCISTQNKRYKQGMHELVAVFYTQLSSLKENSISLNEISIIFSKFMNLHDFTFDEVELINFKNFQFEPLLQSCFPNISKCLEDKHKLNNMIWLLRWCRLIFLREFENIDDVLIIWDFMFTSSSSSSSSSSTEGKKTYRNFISMLIIIFLCYKSKEIICYSQDQSDLLQLFFQFFSNNNEFVHGDCHSNRLLKILKCTHDIVNNPLTMNSVVEIRKAIQELILQDEGCDKEWFKMFFSIFDYNRLKLQQRLKDKMKHVY